MCEDNYKGIISSFENENIMKNLIKISCLLMVLGIFISCEVENSADVNQDKIYADYDLRYNENSDKTTVVARFRFGGPTGTLLELTDNASVLFNDDELPFNILFGGHSKEYSGQITEGEFMYTNTEGVLFTNKAPAYESITYPTGLDSLSKNEAFELVWDGTALKADQRVGLFIGTWTFGEDGLFIEEGDGATSLILAKDVMEDVKTGSSTFFMERTTAVDIAEGTDEGGRIRATYQPENIKVEIIE